MVIALKMVPKIAISKIVPRLLKKSRLGMKYPASWGQCYKNTTVLIEQHILDTSAGKQLSSAATDV